MDTAQALGGILLKALPTFFLVILLHFYLKQVFFKPLGKVLHERYEATEGARKVAEESLARASAKTAEYEAALKKARAELYQEQEQMRRKLQEDRAATVREARAKSEAAITAARQELASDAEKLKKSLDSESEALAEKIASQILNRRAA